MSLVDKLRDDLKPGCFLKTYSLWCSLRCCQTRTLYAISDDRSVRTLISLEKRVAVSLYKLSSSCEYKVVASAFGIHKTSVHRYLHG